MICFLNSERHWGGGEKWHYKMAQLFKKDGFDVILCVNPGSELELKAKEEGISTKSMRISRYSFINPFKIKEVAQFFKNNNVQTVVMNNPIDLKVGTIAGKKVGVKNIIYRRGMPHDIKNTLLNRWLFNNVTDVIAISEEVKRSLLANNPNMVANEKIHLMYNAIDPNDYNPIRKNAGKKVIFGTTGRLVEQKGQHHLIEAALILKNKGLDFKILIAGKGPLEQSLRDMIKSAALEDFIELTGFITDLNFFLNHIDVFVFPSYFEGSAVSVVEAIYFGKPIIAFNVSTLPELIKDGYNGFLTEFKNSEDFASKMAYFIYNKNQISIMGLNSQKEAGKYDLHNVYERLKKIVIN